MEILQQRKKHSLPYTSLICIVLFNSVSDSNEHAVQFRENLEVVKAIVKLLQVSPELIGANMMELDATLKDAADHGTL